MQPIAFGMNFLALGALADTTSPSRWLRVMLAGFAVGLGVSEAYDIGALFSLFVAAFVVVQSLLGEGPVLKRFANGVGRLAVVGVCAGLIAAAALMLLVGTQVKGVGTARMGRDPKSSVLNGHNQVWDAPNVFVTDGSCMTSAACVNPSLTYMALTARAADYAVAELKRGNL
jgi:choline dehydrogenase-like flavoprotein